MAVRGGAAGAGPKYRNQGDGMTILDSFKLEGRVAFVTGGGRGLGRAICVGFAQAGADIVAVSRSAGPLAETVEEVRAEGRRCLAVPCDVTVKSQVEESVARAIQEFGKIDILVNNAGGANAAAEDVHRYYPIEELPEDAWNKLVDLNLKSAFLCSQAVAKVMLNQGRGKIVNIGSESGFTPRAGTSPPYNVAKAGLHNLTKQMALEWGDRGIWANCIAGTAMNTPGFDLAMQARRARGLGESGLSPGEPDRPPVQRHIADPREYVPIALFLASDASNHLTGDIISPGGVALQRT